MPVGGDRGPREERGGGIDYPFRFSVRELTIGGDARPQDGWRLAGAAERRRALLGTQAHTAVLGERAEQSDYQKEVAVQWRIERPLGWVEVFGRVDGLRTTAQGAVVEELKSTVLTREQLQDLEPERAHVEQCLFYCTMLSELGHQVRSASLLYYSLVDGTLTVARLEFDVASARELLLARVDARLEAGRLEEERARARRQAAGALRFPHATVRPVQQQVMQHARESLDGGRMLYCSAPTGTGKTAAALFPLLERALSEDRRLFFATARLSQQALALETVRAMLPPGSPLLAVQLQAKERSCPMPELRCVPGVCPYLTGFAARLQEGSLLAQSGERGVLDGDTLTKLAVDEGLCPYEVSLALARQAVVLICDYNYLFDPRIRLRFLLEEGDRALPLLVVDEAHNLPERARAIHSIHLSLSELRSLTLELEGARVSPGLPGLGPDVLERIDAFLVEVADVFEQKLRALVEEGESSYFVESLARSEAERLASALSELMPDALAAYATNRWVLLTARVRTGRQDPLLGLLFDLQHFLNLTLEAREELATVWFADGTVRTYCLDSGPFLRPQLKSFHAPLFMSATLTPFDYFMEAMGTDSGESLSLELDSPFPPENRLIALVRGFDTRLKNRAQNAENIALFMREIIAVRPGNYLAFFGSFAFRDEVVRHMRDPSLKVLMQSPAMATGPLLEKLRAAGPGESYLLAAVHGGVFSEGVDFSGHLAWGAFIVGPGLPAVTVERELMRAFAEEHGFDGRLRAYIQPAVFRSVQAGGRVIRSESDHGFILLLDDRFSTEAFRSQMPAYWQRELRETDGAADLVRNLWEKETADSLVR